MTGKRAARRAAEMAEQDRLWAEGQAAIQRAYMAIGDAAIELERRERFWHGVGYVAGGILVMWAYRKPRSVKVL